MPLDSDLPKGRNQLPVVVALLLGFVVILYLADYLLTEAGGLGSTRHGLLARSILENTIAGAFAAIVLALSCRWAVRLVEPGDRVIEIPPGAISDRLKNNARRTSRYGFIGNTATFVTAAVLPILCARSQRSGQSVFVRIFIIDPRDTDVVTAYVRHKSRVRVSNSKIADYDLASWTRPSGESAAESFDMALSKLYACLYLCAYASKSSGVEIIVHLRKSFTPFRADVSDSEVILTQESASEAAVAFSANGHFYGWYDKETEALLQQCTPVALTGNVDVERIHLAHPSSARTDIERSFDELFSTALKGLNIVIGAGVRGAAIDKIIIPSHSYNG